MSRLRLRLTIDAPTGSGGGGGGGGGAAGLKTMHAVSPHVEEIRVLAAEIARTFQVTAAGANGQELVLAVDGFELPFTQPITALRDGDHVTYVLTDFLALHIRPSDWI